MMGKTKTIKSINDVIPQVRNSNKHTQRGLGLLESSIQNDGWIGAMTIAADGETFDGSARAEVGVAAGFDDAIIVDSDGSKPVIVRRIDIPNADDKRAKRLGVAANRIAQIDFDPDLEVLAELVDEGVELNDLWSDEEMAEMLAGIELPETDEGAGEEATKQTLAERFGVPPFSVLDARQGYWQDRKDGWLSLGLKSEDGRDENIAFARSAQTPAIYELRNKMRAEAGGVDPPWEEILAEATKRGMYLSAGTSIFDPVLCELAYRWFSPDAGSVLDPFAGGSVRGIVAAKLGRHYTGVDLSARQIEANNAQAAEIIPENLPTWINGDSLQVIPAIKEEFDFVFSCPPYADLEVYSEDPKDLSTMDYESFVMAYSAIIAAAISKLKDNRFACFVVGDVRDKKGFYRNFVGDTINAFQSAGATLYNEAILVTSVGSLAIRVGKQFDAGRKLGKTHQNILVFFKGDPKTIKSTFGACEFGEITEDKDTIETGETWSIG